MKIRLLIFLVIVGGLIALLVYSQHRQLPPKASGFIEAHEIRIGSRVGGRIARVLVQEGQSVKTGQPLLELEPFDLLAKQTEARATASARQADYQRVLAGPRPEEITQAKARRDQLAARLDKLKAGPRKQEITEAQAVVEAAEAQHDLAQTTFNRVKRTFETNAASHDELERATDDLKVAAATIKARTAQLDVLLEGSRKEDIADAAAQLAEAQAALALLEKGSRIEDIAQTKAAAEAAQAALAAVDSQLQELQVKAPVDGVVEAVEIRPGDLVGPNAPALSLLDLGELWVRAYVPENRLDIQTGQKLPITIDSFPGRQFAGHVSFVSHDAEFTPGNVQTPEERSKQVFRIKVVLDEGRDLLRPGMSADVWLSPAKTPGTAP
jgi:HlyD family secretion protein